MALNLRNRNLAVATNLQLDKLNTARWRSGQHVYYQENGESTTKGYKYGLATQITNDGEGVDVALRVGKGFFMKFHNEIGVEHYEYRYPASPGSTTAHAQRQYNQEDRPIETKTSKNFVLPGLHVLSIYLNIDYNFTFTIDNKQILDKPHDIINSLQQLLIKSENGAVFEVHHTAVENYMVFEESDIPRRSPTLTLGGYVEVTAAWKAGQVPRIFLLQHPVLLAKETKPKDYNVRMTQILKLPASVVPDEDFTCYIKYYRSYLTFDYGAGIDVVPHKFQGVARYYARGMDIHNMTVVTGPSEQ